MPPFQLIIRLRYGAEGEDNVVRRATAVGAVGLGVHPPHGLGRTPWDAPMGMGWNNTRPMGWGATFANHPVAMACAYECVKHTIKHNL